MSWARPYRLRLRLLACGTTVVLACGRSPAAEPPAARAGTLRIDRPFVPVLPAPDVAALYFSVTNTDSVADTISQVQTSLGDATMHRLVSQGNAQVMRPSGPVPVPPHGTVTFAPGGLHIMIERLETPLRPGDSLRVTVTFANAGPVSFNSPVIAFRDMVRMQGSEAHP